MSGGVVWGLFAVAVVVTGAGVGLLAALYTTRDSILVIDDEDEVDV